MLPLSICAGYKNAKTQATDNKIKEFAKPTKAKDTTWRILHANVVSVCVYVCGYVMCNALGYIYLALAYNGGASSQRQNNAQKLNYR